MKKLLIAPALAAILALLAGCDGVNNPGDGSSAGWIPPGHKATGHAAGAHHGGRHIKLTVMAASSLTGPFGELAKTYEQQHKGTKVTLVLDSSATLVQQLQNGAPGGVLATADKKTMDAAVAAQVVAGKPAEFATNTLVLAVPANNPAHLKSFADLNKPGVKYLTCVTTAPCGNLAQQLLTKDKVAAKPASQETDVKAVLAKVESGEADAGLVYASDVKSSNGKVTSIAIPGAQSSPNLYFIAVAAGVKHAKAAQAWVTLVESQIGQQILRQAGFGAPK